MLVEKIINMIAPTPSQEKCVHKLANRLPCSPEKFTLVLPFEESEATMMLATAKSKPPTKLNELVSEHVSCLDQQTIDRREAASIRTSQMNQEFDVSKEVFFLHKTTNLITSGLAVESNPLVGSSKKRIFRAVISGLAIENLRL